MGMDFNGSYFQKLMNDGKGTFSITVREEMVSDEGTVDTVSVRNHTNCIYQMYK